MPPLARPISPRHPCRRVASTSWRSAEPAANPPSPKASSGAMPSAPSSTGTTRQATPRQAGQNRRVRSNSVDALRHGRTGAMAINVRSASPSGVVMRSKKGRPTESRRSCSASTTSGNTVPSSTTKANTANSTLLARKAASRESGESIVPGERSRSPRQPMSTMDVPAESAKNASR